MSIKNLRKTYHDNLVKDLLLIHKSSKKDDYPSNADGDSKISVKIAWGIISKITDKPNYGTISGQYAGKKFEQITKEFISKSFENLQHLRPGNWNYFVEKEISMFDQYRDLAEIETYLQKNKKLASSFGQDYIIKSDLIIAREAVEDEHINKVRKLVNSEEEFAIYTPLRQKNNDPLKPILHASISCKWTLRSDRAQNIRTEANNLIKNRKGKLPHIAAVTAEPTLSRIASLALGTGDIDCVYHFALNELRDTLFEIKDETQLDLFNILVEGRRLRDISDLPFDLAI